MKDFFGLGKPKIKFKKPSVKKPKMKLVKKTLKPKGFRV